MNSGVTIVEFVQPRMLQTNLFVEFDKDTLIKDPL